MAMSDIPVLETPRLRLTALTERHFDDYAKMLADAESTRWIGDGQPLDRMNAWRSMAMLLGHWALRGCGMWAIELKDSGDFTILGTGQGRIDALDIVTGRKQFTMDLPVPNALPTMVARPPTINGVPVSVNNEADILGMPGVTDVAVLPNGVAIRAATQGQCIDAIQEIDVTWGPGTVDGLSDSGISALR